MWSYTWSANSPDVHHGHAFLSTGAASDYLRFGFDVDDANRVNTQKQTEPFAVASYAGETRSDWVWTELMVEAVTPHFCPITGLAIPEGYLSVNESTTAIDGQSFTLTGITRKSTVTLGGTAYTPFTGRQFLKVCGTVKAPSDSWTIFFPGSDNNLSTDLGVGFNFPDDSITDWYAVGLIPAGETKSACDIWDVPAGASTIIYAVNNFQADAGVFLVNLP
jgi:hypothetical protein